MVKCTINGKEVEVEKGTTIIQAFKEINEEIAHYCWHPGLSIAGVCRLCMVEIEGNPRLQIACNTPVQEGMVISNQSEMVKDAVKWGLDFHLINHPLDCPICDQAGECGLQDQYMQFGQYDPEMGKNKVKKRKVVDLGERVVLDSERCILCSRCVRFTEEVSKTNELGIFNRGDRSEIGTFEDKPLNNKYSVNTVDICPVGALTSKDFRFRQRVWFLQDKPSICTGCSTGCSIDVYYNKEGVWRVKPRHSEVNGYWMCDEGREIYRAVNHFKTEFVGERDSKKVVKKKNRLTSALQWTNGIKENTDTIHALQNFAQELAGYRNPALVVTGQYSNEELESLIGFWVERFGKEHIYHWINHPDKLDEFDGLLIRGDKNPNTKGLQAVLDKHGVKNNWDGLDHEIKGSNVDLIMVAGPENQWLYEDIQEKLDLFMQAERLVWMTACWIDAIDQKESGGVLFIPTKAFAEKNGSFTNFEGKVQRFEKVDTFIENALYLNEVVDILQGKELDSRDQRNALGMVHNEFIEERERPWA